MHFLDFIFPKRCVGCKKFGSYVCISCFASISFLDSGICVVCQRPAIDGLTHIRCRTPYTIDGVFSSLLYKGVVKKLVYAFKYPPFLTDLQSMLIDLLYEGLIQKEQFYRQLTPEAIVVPVPLHRNRLRLRGYNQSHLLADGLAKRLGLQMQNILVRVRNTTTQTKLSRKERQENMRGAFMIRGNERNYLTNTENVFLIDDVLTSGTTLIEAAKVLKKAGIEKVWGVTLAHGE